MKRAIAVMAFLSMFGFGSAAAQKDKPAAEAQTALVIAERVHASQRQLIFIAWHPRITPTDTTAVVWG
jgi:hypothetical protein